MPVRLALLAAALLLAGPATAQFLPDGPEFGLNQTVAGNQTFPHTAALENGAVVAVWQSEGVDGSGLAVVVRLLATDGTFLTPEAQVNEATAGNQSKPRVAALPSGGFVVVWQSADADGLGVFGRIYDAAGSPTTDEFRVNGRQTDDQARPDVAGLAGGGYAVAWDESRGGLGADVFVQVFDAVGTRLGSSRTHRYRDGDQSAAAVAGLEAGGLVVAWESQGQDGAGSGIYARTFDALGEPATTFEVRLNEDPAGSQTRPALLGVAGGGFVAAWQGPDADGVGVFARYVEADGAAPLPEGIVSQTEAGNHGFPALGVDGAGRTVVAWQQSQAGSPDQIFARVLDGDGLPTGPARRVDEASTEDQRSPVVIGGARPGVAWHGRGHDGDGFGVEARWIDVGPALGPEPVTPEFQVNETGGASLEQQVTAAPLSDGGALVAWREQGQPSEDRDRLLARRYDADGAPVGGEVTVVDSAGATLYEPALAALEPGRLVLVWSDRVALDDHDVLALFVDESGAPLGPAFQVNETTTRFQSSPTAFALPTGEFVVVWESDVPDGEGGFTNRVFGRRYGGDGTPLDGEFEVSVAPGLDHEEPVGAALGGGGFLIAWSALDYPASGALFARRYDAAGLPLGGEITVRSGGFQFQYGPSASTLDGGGAVVAWTPAEDGTTGFEAYGQVFGPDGALEGGPILLPASTAGDERPSAVMAVEGGGFIAAWSAFGPGTRGLHLRQFGPDREPLTQEILGSVDGGPQHIALVPLVGRRFLAVWTAGSSREIRGRVFEADVPPPAIAARTPSAGLEAAPPEATLGAPRPNPAAGRVTVPLALPAEAAVRLEALDALGRVVLTRDLGTVPAGGLEAPLDVSGLAPGVYVVRAVVGGPGAPAVRARTLTVVR